jgi:hypothetical protein
MSQFEDQQGDALQISAELASAMIALGIDWNNEQSLRELAREALAYKPDDIGRPVEPGDIKGHARLKFFGLVALMFKTMEEGADENELVHGSDVWKAVARALWAEKGDSAR